MPYRTHKITLDPTFIGGNRGVSFPSNVATQGLLTIKPYQILR